LPAGSSEEEFCICARPHTRGKLPRDQTEKRKGGGEKRHVFRHRGTTHLWKGSRPPKKTPKKEKKKKKKKKKPPPNNKKKKTTPPKKKPPEGGYNPGLFGGRGKKRGGGVGSFVIKDLKERDKRFRQVIDFGGGKREDQRGIISVRKKRGKKKRRRGKKIRKEGFT